jgi:tyrosinase
LHRRTFLASAATATGMAALGAAPARAAKYTRYNVTGTEGRQMLASYAKGVAAMLQLPPDHPHAWFRNDFTHFMDCPHGNWWFYVWHRGYVGYVEQTIRKLSDDSNFACRSGTGASWRKSRTTCLTAC